MEILLAEKKRRLEAKASVIQFNPDEYCFDKQLEFIADESKRKVACNSRRSGKTVTCAVHLVHTAVTLKGVNCLYITLSRLNAKRIIWRELCDLNARFKLHAKENLSELTLEFLNGSRIYLAGASDESEIEKFRGMALKLVYIDEAQAFKSYLERLIHEVLSPALYDYDGELCLIGTPPPVCAGVFFDAYHQKEGYKGFKPFHWTIFDNPFIEKKSGKTVEALINADLEAKGLPREHPTIQREIYGRFVEDSSALVYQYDETRNLLDEDPNHYSASRCYFSIGVDLGFDDADAIIVWQWREHDPTLRLVYEFKKSKLSLTELAAILTDLQAKYPNARKVIDTGGLGKKITEELVTRYKIHLEPAEKVRKMEYIALMNEDLRKGLIKVPKGSKLLEEWRLLQWDRDFNPPKIDERFEDHLCFVDGTMIATTKNALEIESLRVGDMVKGKEREQRVVATMAREAETILLTFSNKTQLACTPDHPFYTTHGLIKAKDLTHERCFTVNGSVTLEASEPLGKKVVYNITCEPDHHYYANGFLVSNCDAALYSYREARHYTAKPKVVKPTIDSDAHIRQHWDKLAKANAKKIKANWWEK